MISTNAAYKAAITGDYRKILLRAEITIISPDLVYGTGNSSGQTIYSKPEQLYDGVTELSPHYDSLELNRWTLGGTVDLLPNDPTEAEGQFGIESDVLSGEDGTFANPPWAELTFSGVSILQACSVYFPTADYDGFPVDFTVDIMQGGTSYYTATFTGNTAKSVLVSGFTVNNPDAIRVTATKWSLPYRRMRTVDIFPGIFELWTGDQLAAFTITQQANFSSLALPYGTCTLSLDNLDRRFEPRNKQGIFKSIEERQGINMFIGVEDENGEDIFMPVGVYYQYSGGWKTGDNGMTMNWDLVDIIGLLTEREFILSGSAPTTLEGWVAALVAQLGTNFAGMYTVDPNYASTALSLSDTSVLSGKTCGEILLWVTLASGTWARADNETGYLTVEPLWNEGNTYTLDNLNNYPVIKANQDLAAIIFDLNGTSYVVSGNSTSSSDTVSVSNPFITTQTQALAAAKIILATYGGNKLETTGRGDPSSEIGDVDTVWLDESGATTGRRQYQTFTFQNGVLRNCESVLLQADGSFLFENRAVITESGTWTAPSGVTSLRVILVGKGENGTAGTAGSMFTDGVDGVDGVGGKVWASTININDGQTFNVSIGDDTVFGSYSSANGQTYANGYTDVASGDSFARTGVAVPVAGSGDGGAGGRGGVKGNYYITEDFQTVVVSAPTAGTTGAVGATGCVVVYWDKEDG